MGGAAMRSPAARSCSLRTDSIPARAATMCGPSACCRKSSPCSAKPSPPRPETRPEMRSPLVRKDLGEWKAGGEDHARLREELVPDRSGDPVGGDGRDGHGRLRHLLGDDPASQGRGDSGEAVALDAGENAGPRGDAGGVARLARPRRTQARPRTLANHQRRPTNRNRQSLRNSGGFFSYQWPTNWKIQPTTNRAAAQGQSAWSANPARASNSDSAIIGMPTV